MPVHHVTIDEAPEYILELIRRTRSRVESSAESRAGEMLDALQTTASVLLTGPRSGRVYRDGMGGWYTASAPGELPAERSGGLRWQWGRTITTIPTARGFTSTIRLKSQQPYAAAVESKRPFERAILTAALPMLREISRRRYVT